MDKENGQPRTHRMASAWFLGKQAELCENIFQKVASFISKENFKLVSGKMLKDRNVIQLKLSGNTVQFLGGGDRAQNSYENRDSASSSAASMIFGPEPSFDASEDLPF